MGYEKFKRPLLVPEGVVAPVASSGIQTITGSGVSTAAALTDIAADAQLVTIATTGTGAGFEVKLASGRRVGSSVTVAVAAASTVPTILLLESTTQSLFGSTFNAVTFSTNSSGASVTLTKVSSAAYVIAGQASMSTLSRPVFGGSTGTV